MTKDETRALIREELAAYFKEQDAQPLTAAWQWEQAGRVKALEITDATRPLAPCTRLEAAIMAANAARAALRECPCQESTH